MHYVHICVCVAHPYDPLSVAVGDGTNTSHLLAQVPHRSTQGEDATEGEAREGDRGEREGGREGGWEGVRGGVREGGGRDLKLGRAHV